MVTQACYFHIICNQIVYTLPKCVTLYQAHHTLLRCVTLFRQSLTKSVTFSARYCFAKVWHKGLHFVRCRFAVRIKGVGGVHRLPVYPAVQVLQREQYSMMLRKVIALAKLVVVVTMSLVGSKNVAPLRTIMQNLGIQSLCGKKFLIISLIIQLEFKRKWKLQIIHLIQFVNLRLNWK